MSKKNKIILFAIIGIIILAFIGYFVYFKKTIGEEELSLEEILDKLTAPAPGPPVPQEVLDKLTAPGPGPEVPQEVLDKLTAPK